MSKLEEMKDKIKESKKTVIKKAKEKFKKVKDKAATVAVGVATAATVGASFAPQSAEAATPDNHDDQVTWVNGVNPNKSTISLTLPDGTVINGTPATGGIGAQPVEELPSYTLGGRSSSRGRTTSFNQQRQQMAASSQYQAQCDMVGPHGEALMYSEAYSYGLKRSYAGAFINPNEDIRTAHVYMYKYDLQGNPVFATKFDKSYLDAGHGPYAIPFRQRQAVIAGAHGWSGGYGAVGGNVSVDVGHGGVGVSVGGAGRGRAGRASVRISRGGRVSINVGGISIGR